MPERILTPLSDRGPNDAAQLRALTRELLLKAKAGDWDTVVALESERRPLLYRLFGAAVAPAEQPHYRALIGEILSTDRELTQLAQQRREELAGALRKIGAGRSGCQAYVANSR